MKILVIDGQGGKLGAQIITNLKQKNNPLIEITAVGTNALATEAMLKAKPNIIATGENPVVVNSRYADIIIGPIGIVIADSLYGEITPKMALAVSQSKAVKLLIPMNKCGNIIVGVTDNLLEDSFKQINDYIDKSL